MKRASLLFALLLPLIAACDDVLFTDPDDVFLRLDQSVYAAGDTVILRLVNESGETIDYNLCDNLVQRLVGDDWVDTLYGRQGRLCPLVLYRLRHGASDTYPTILDAETPAGTYRYRTWVDTRAERNLVVYSRSFEVN